MAARIMRPSAGVLRCAFPGGRRECDPRALRRAGRAEIQVPHPRSACGRQRRRGAARPVASNRRPAVPEIVVYMFEGRTLDQKRGLVRSITDAVTGALGVPQETVTVQLIEGSRQNRARAGRLISDMDAAKAGG